MVKTLKKSIHPAYFLGLIILFVVLFFGYVNWIQHEYFVPACKTACVEKGLDYDSFESTSLRRAVRFSGCNCVDSTTSSSVLIENFSSFFGVKDISVGLAYWFMALVPGFIVILFAYFVSRKKL